MPKLIPTLNDNDLINNVWLPGSISMHAKNIIKIQGFTVLELCGSPTGTIFNKESTYVSLSNGTVIPLRQYYENHMTLNADGTYAKSTVDITLYTDAEDITILASNITIMQNVSIRKLTCGSNASETNCELNLLHIKSLHELAIKNTAPAIRGGSIDIMYCDNTFMFYTYIFNKVKKVIMRHLSLATTGSTIPSVTGTIIETRAHYTTVNNWLRSNLDTLKNSGYTVYVK